MHPGTIGAIAASIGVPAAFAVLKLMAPYQPPSGGHSRSFEELRAEYRKWEIFAALPFLLFTAGLGSACYLGFRCLANLAASSLEPSRFVVLPDLIFWMLPAIFLGMVLATISVNFLYKALLRERCEEFTVYCNMKVGFDGEKFERWMLAAIILVVTVGVALALNCYTQFFDEAIVIKPVLALRTSRYPFDQVDAVAAVRQFTAPNRQTVVRPHYAIRFKDGATWTTREGLRDPDPKRDRPIIEFVSQVSKKPIQQLDSIEELDRGKPR